MFIGGGSTLRGESLRMQRNRLGRALPFRIASTCHWRDSSGALPPLSDLGSEETAIPMFPGHPEADPGRPKDLFELSGGTSDGQCFPGSFPPFIEETHRRFAPLSDLYSKQVGTPARLQVIQSTAMRPDQRKEMLSGADLFECGGDAPD
jgi:hypothetical protein